MQAGGSTGGGETARFDGLPKFSFEPESCCFDVASNGAHVGMLNALEAVTIFDGPSEGANELDSLGAVGQQELRIG